MANQIVHPTQFPRVPGCGVQDLVVYKNLYKEYYARIAPLLSIRSLSKDRTKVNDFYRETKRQDRKYDDYNVHVFGPLDQYEYNAGYFGIDATRNLTAFSICIPELDDLGLELKPGDVILYDGVENEIMTIKRLEDAYFAQTNYCFEFAIATIRPETGS